MYLEKLGGSVVVGGEKKDSALYQAAEPVFIDSEPESWNMSPAALKRAFVAAQKAGKLPKAVIVASLYGQSADMTPLLELCEHYGVAVIEDASESLGATYKEKAVGTSGKFGVYSFDVGQMITTSGGGMLVSDDTEALEKARSWVDQGEDTCYSDVGYDYRLSNVLAGIGRGQLQVLAERVKARRTIFNRYYEFLAGIKEKKIRCI